MSPQRLPPSEPPPRHWPIALPAAGVAVVAVIWSVFWYYASGRAETAVTAWRAHESEAGRLYDCSRESFGGYPFRIEFDCDGPAVDDRRAGYSIRVRHLAAVAQVWDPTLVIGELTGPATIAVADVPAATIDWGLAQASLRARPGVLDRLSVVLDKPNLGSAQASGQGGLGGQGTVSSAAGPLAKAEHAEFHARFAADSTPGHPVLDLAFDVSQFAAPGLVASLGAPFGALAAAPTDGSVIAVLRGADDLSPKQMAERLREFQTADGRLDITNARFAQGDLIAAATGSLDLTPRGTLNGTLRLTIINFEALIPLLGIDRALARIVAPETVARVAPGLDRLLPGLGNVLRGGNGATATANAAAGALGAAALGGQPAELEGRRAVALTLRFDNGDAFLGPVKIGQVPPLFTPP